MILPLRSTREGCVWNDLTQQTTPNGFGCSDLVGPHCDPACGVSKGNGENKKGKGKYNKKKEDMKL